MDPFFDGRQMLRTAEVAELIKMPYDTVKKWLHEGVPIPHYHPPGRMRCFDRDEVLAWWESLRKYAPPSAIPTPPDTTGLNVDQRLIVEKQYRERIEALPPKPAPVELSPLAALTFEERVVVGKKYAITLARIVAKEMQERGEEITLASLMAKLAE